jgi:hypothetical protein
VLLKTTGSMAQRSCLFLVAVFITKIASRGPAAHSSRYSPVDGQDEATASDKQQFRGGPQ